MQVVTFETAKRLKEAGFPQPTQTMGQFWYDPKGRLTLTAFDDSYGDMAASVMTQYVYAATAADLIPTGWQLKRIPKIPGMENAEEWTCDSMGSDPLWYHNDNPAEAAAMAWLHVNRNQSNV